MRLWAATDSQNMVTPFQQEVDKVRSRERVGTDYCYQESGPFNDLSLTSVSKLTSSNAWNDREMLSRSHPVSLLALGRAESVTRTSPAFPIERSNRANLHRVEGAFPRSPSRFLQKCLGPERHRDWPGHPLTESDQVLVKKCCSMRSRRQSVHRRIFVE